MLPTQQNAWLALIVGVGVTGGGWWLVNIHWGWDLDWWIFLIFFAGLTGGLYNQLNEDSANAALADQLGDPAAPAVGQNTPHSAPVLPASQLSKSPRRPVRKLVGGLLILVLLSAGIGVAAAYFISPERQLALIAAAPQDLVGIVPGIDAYKVRLNRQADANAAQQEREAAAKAREEAEDERADRHLLAQLACVKAVRRQVRFPTKAKFDPGLFQIANVGPLVDDPSVVGVRGRVDLMNGFGAMIPHVYGCDVRGETVLRVAVEPG